MSGDALLSIELSDVGKHFGRFQVLDHIHLRFPAGRLSALLGPSGSGKTTLLRLIAGLESPDQGVIRFAGEDVSHLHVSRRQVGFVFQHYALFKHMTVFDNVAYGLKIKPWRERPSKPVIRKRVMALLELVQLAWAAKHLPAQLSGGQRQRIALARALAVEPRVLLLDEPFGALDAQVRAQLRAWLKQLHREIAVTTLFVTHDQEEALEISDHIVIMNQGRIEQSGSPQQVYDQPANPFVCTFLGQAHQISAHLRQGVIYCGDQVVGTAAPGLSHEGAVRVYIRPHDIEVLPPDDTRSALTATLEQIAMIGPYVRLALRLHATQALIPADMTQARFAALHIAADNTVQLVIRKPHVFV
ncbi:sulfate/molybdate ABC transporter ATP-binding protein [Thiorhodospira sibirica]|uniref:sulfate/molybdate ABC transporter ATP-binding protein n=1 Tax=Thiorhodospira sibirica TaxID=154347 RepID=UPI00022C3FFD|nr:sulfate ABC transporter ATP-binding protein [Thiorhodospira sibirica]